MQMKSPSNPTISTDKFISDAIEKATGIGRYREIMERYRSCNVATDKEFQRLYTGFYRVRRNADWLAYYFIIMNGMKGIRIPTIRAIMSAFANFRERRIELSFASKMLHTIRPEMPIWDSVVCANLGMDKVPLAGSFDERTEAACRLYDSLCEKMNALLADERVGAEIAKFDAILPKFASLTPMKKLDFLLWQNRTDAV